MHTPRLGEIVKVVADTTWHGLALGSFIKIGRVRNEDTWWVHDRDIFVAKNEIARLSPALRKVMKNLEKNVTRALEEVPADLPNRAAIVRHVMKILGYIPVY